MNGDNSSKPHSEITYESILTGTGVVIFGTVIDGYVMTNPTPVTSATGDLASVLLDI